MEMKKDKREERMTRTELFKQRVVIMRNSEPRPTDEDVVKKLSKHFCEGVQMARRVQNIVTIRNMERIF